MKMAIFSGASCALIYCTSCMHLSLEQLLHFHTLPSPMMTWLVPCCVLGRCPIIPDSPSMDTRYTLLDLLLCSVLYTSLGSVITAASNLGDSFKLWSKNKFKNACCFTWFRKVKLFMSVNWHIFVSVVSLDSLTMKWKNKKNRNDINTN